MKKLNLLLYLLVLLSGTLFSKDENSPNLLGKYFIQKDSDGYSYVSGTFSSQSIKFGNTVLQNSGYDDIFVASFNPDGKILWAVKIGSRSNDVIKDFILNENEDILLIYNSESNSFFNDDIIIPAGETETILNKNGNLVSSSTKKNNSLKKENLVYTLTYPEGGEQFSIGTTRIITWTTPGTGSNYLKFEYSTNNGSSWQYIATLPEYIGFYKWTIPNTPSLECKVRFINLADSSIQDECTTFTISGNLNWYKQASITSYQLNSVYFITEEIGFAAGFDGIFKTTDSGLNWFQQISGFGLMSIHFTSADIGYSVGIGGTIFKTLDGGINWNQQFSGTNNTFTQVQFISPLKGWIVGETEVLRTTNGGINWTPYSPTSHILQSVYFINELNGWVVGGEGVVFKTTDGGINWIEQLSNGTNYSQLLSVYFVDENLGWICGSGLTADGGLILKTTNGGNTWNLNSEGWKEFLYSVYFLDSNIGWASGNEGVLLNTQDGGNTWVEKGSGSFDDFLDINFLNSKNGWSVGNNGTIIKYSSQPINPPVWTADIAVTVSGGVETVLVYGQSAHGTDNIDVILNEQEIPNPYSYGQFDVRFQLPNSKYTKIDYRNSSNTNITWKIKFQPGMTGYPLTFRWEPSDFPEGSFILKDADSDLININMKEEDHFVVTSNLISKILIEFIASPLPVELSSFTSSVKNNYVELSWVTLSEKNNKGFEVYKKNLSNQSSDWKPIGFVEGIGSSTEKKSYSFLDSEINSGRYIYKLKQIDFDGSYEYSNEIEVIIVFPDKFELSQNYPNPFNPDTKIKFTVPQSKKQEGENITIKVYDILGNEVAVLLNELKSAGSYEINLDAASLNLSSGTYIYRLTSRSFSSTKKMVLLK
jgi:photosystem II stability/assembly factor-like uncharacterized protein